MTMTPKKTATALAVLLTGGALLVATTAMAHGPRGDGLDFSTLDADGNGEITAAEFEAHKMARIAAVDTDGDGVLSLEELQSMGQGRKAARAEARFERMIERLDENGDGQISVEEFAAMSGRRGGGEGLPGRMDTDGSGGISEEEFAAFFEMMEDRRGKRGLGKHGGQGQGKSE